MTFVLIFISVMLPGVYYKPRSHLGFEMDTSKDFSQMSRRASPLLLLGFGLLLIAGSVYAIFQTSPAQSELAAVPVEVKYPAPKLTLSNLQGDPVSLVDFRGRVILVNLWATWCPPCKAEMPALESFYRKHKEQGFTIVAVNDGDPTSDVIQFVADYGLTFPVWLDPTYIATEQAFKTLSLPSSFVINRQGNIVLTWIGGINKKNLEQYVTPIIQSN
jgi:cytochrome c biogenesis protein CcmG, thiol:disulfide interchange protein DsbE